MENANIFQESGPDESKRMVGKGKAPKKLQMRVGATDVSFYHGQVTTGDYWWLHLGSR